MTDNEDTIESFTRKRGVVIGAALLAMLLALGLGWLAIGSLSNTFAHSTIWPIREVNFSGQMKRVDAAELKRVAGGIQRLGNSLLGIDLNEVRLAVKEIEWVREVAVRRRFPGTLQVEIEEQVPVARWQRVADDEDTALVNSSGELFVAETEESLPLLVGPAGSAGEVLAAYQAFSRQTAVIGQAVTEVQLSPRRAWRLKFASGSTLVLGRNDAAERLARFVRAYPRVAALHAGNARIDARYQTGLAVRGGEGRNTGKTS